MIQQFTDLHSSVEKDEKPDKQGSRSTVLHMPDESGKPDTSVPSDIKTEIGGPAGLEPTRFGDWEVNGRCSDF